MSRSPIKWINASDPPEAFPRAADAASEPDGLLAAGGDLSSDRLIYAYRHGIFPWYDDGQPILWWSPNPRCVMLRDRFRLSKRLKRSVRNSALMLSVNTAFDDVIAACAENRAGQPGTWITPDMVSAYTRLHREGWAHSIEVWAGERLAGGLYGLAIGRAFFGESMFSVVSNASKLALFLLSRLTAQQDFPLIDCQVRSAHLESLGASNMDRGDFIRLLDGACRPPHQATFWPNRRIAATELLDSGRHALQ